MQLHQIKRQHSRQRHKLIGRGGKRGTTSGRGTKGQRARSGHRIRPEMRDVIKRLPKKRGHRFVLVLNKTVTVSLAAIAHHFSAGETISPATLAAKRLISASTLRRGRVKIIGAATVAKDLTIKDCLISRPARQIIEQAGGKIIARQIVLTHAK
ncbi:MAG TPA: uL15 family ribosomal protein [Candidatus Paceibacterota bacterium]